MNTKLKKFSELDPKLQELFRLAQAARAKAYAPYSNYLVGAIVIDEQGISHSGCNVENAAYPAGICAERTAIAKMISRGGKKLSKVLIAASSEMPAMPCGMCRQVIREFAEDCDVLSVSPDLTFYCEAKLSELLPFSFSGDNLKS